MSTKRLKKQALLGGEPACQINFKLLVPRRPLMPGRLWKQYVSRHLRLQWFSRENEKYLIMNHSDGIGISTVFACSSRDIKTVCSIVIYINSTNIVIISPVSSDKHGASVGWNFG